MDVERSLAFAREQKRGVLGTLRRDGRSQLSNVLFSFTSDGLVQVSLTAGRAKTHNIRRDPRVVTHFTDRSFWQYAVLDGTAELGEVTKDPADRAAEQLVEYYRSVVGEHPNWQEYRAAMVTEQRLVATITPTSAYGQIND